MTRGDAAGIGSSPGLIPSELRASHIQAEVQDKRQLQINCDQHLKEPTLNNSIKLTTSTHNHSPVSQIMTISNGINGHANGHTNGHTNGNETASKNGVLFAKPHKASISSIVSELFEDNITAKILHAAESGLVNNVSAPQFDVNASLTLVEPSVGIPRVCSPDWVRCWKIHPP